MFHHHLMLTVNQDPRRIFVLDCQIDEAAPRLCSRMNACGCEDVVVDLPQSGLDVAFELSSVLPVERPLHKFLSILAVLTVLRPLFDDGPNPCEYLTARVLLQGSRLHDGVEKLSHRFVFGCDGSRKLKKLKCRPVILEARIFEATTVE